MRKLKVLILVMLLCKLGYSNADPFKQIKTEFKVAFESLVEDRDLQLDLHRQNMKYINLKIEKCDDPIVLIELLNSERKLKSSIENIEIQSDLALTKLRYQKGIDLMRLLFEKILGLDHHFTSLRTFQNISDLTNPNTFPAFVQSKDAIFQRLDKKKRINLPDVLEGNPFVSMTMSLVSSFVGNGAQKDKEAELKKVACILDFTVKMHSDLNIIYYETEFLKDSNSNLKAKAIDLFKSYTSVIDYHASLTSCRSNDDWDTLNDKLDMTIQSLEEGLSVESGYEKTKTIKAINNLEFSIDRLLNFLDQYSDFIVEGEQYYGKFETILSSYDNESVCLDYMPHQFNDLRTDVESSILKFSEAYDISEIKGSKLRDLLYGIPQ